MWESILQLQNIIQILVVIRPGSKNNDKTKVYKGIPIYSYRELNIKFLLKQEQNICATYPVGIKWQNFACVGSYELLVL